MDRIAELMQVIDGVYAAATEPAEWGGALERITQAFRAGHTIVAAMSATGPQLVASARADIRDVRRHLDAHGLMGPLEFSALPLGEVTMRDSLVDDATFLRSDYYNEFIKPLDGFHSAFFRQNVADATFALALCRPQRAPRIEAEDAERLRLVLPHVSNAVELHYRLRAAESRTLGLAFLLDRLDSGVLLTDAQARPLFMNESACRLVEENDGLGVAPSGLTAATPAETRRLREGVAELARGVTDPSGMAQARGAGKMHMCIQRPSMRPALVLDLLPVWRLGMTVAGARAPSVAIFIREPDAPTRIDREAVADAFRLTAREAEIAALLAEGNTLDEAARCLEIGVGTARNHLKRALYKTDTRSQAALVRILQRFVEHR